MTLKISNLSKTYSNGVRALKNITLEIPNRIYGLLGPNGAGKSTLMRTPATLQETDAGEIFLGDIDLLNCKDEVRRVLGYLPQEFGIRLNTQETPLLIRLFHFHSRLACRFITWH